jgi:hypothetical protein
MLTFQSLPAEGGFLSGEAADLPGSVSSSASAEGVRMSEEDVRFPADGVFLSGEHVRLSAAAAVIFVSAEVVLLSPTEGILWREVGVSETCARNCCSAAMPQGGCWV